MAFGARWGRVAAAKQLRRYNVASSQDERSCMMKSTRYETVFSVICAAVLTFGLVAANGCGPKKPAGMPKTKPLTITVLKDGAPLADCTILLVDSSNTGGWTVSGTTGADGKAAIQTIMGAYIAKGAPDGIYKAALTVPVTTEIESKPLNDSELRGKTPAELAEMGRKSKDEVAAAYDAARVLPVEYDLPSTSPVTVEVGPSIHEATIEIR